MATSTSTLNLSVANQSLWGSGAGLNLQYTFDTLVVNLDDASYVGQPSLGVAGATLGIDYALTMSNTAFGIPVELGLSGGVYSLAYPASVATALPSQVRAGDTFTVLSGLSGVGAAALSVEGPSVTLSERIMFRTDLSGHLGLEWSGIPLVDDGALALVGSTADGGVTYTNSGLPWELGYDLISLSADGDVEFNEDLSGSTETLGDQNVFSNQFMAFEYDLSPGRLDASGARSTGADGLVDMAGIAMPDAPWLSLNFDIDDITGALLTLVNPALGKLVRDLDTEYSVDYSVLGYDFGTKLEGGLLSLTGSLGVQLVLKF